jgi:hypothetical protein
MMETKPVLYAYFYSTREAQMAVRQIDIWYDCSAPEFVTPVNGRPVLVVISEPAGSELVATHYSPELLNKAIEVVMKYNGRPSDQS